MSDITTLELTGNQQTLPAIRFDFERLKPYLDIRDFGANGADANDDTTAFNQAIAQGITAGADTIVVPRGVYNVDEIIIPGVNLASAGFQPIRILGLVPPAKTFGTIGDTPMPMSGCVIKSFRASAGAIIRVAQSTTGYLNFSSIHLIVESLILCAPDNPFISGIDAREAYQMTARNLQIYTTVYSVQASLPTRDTAGIITPKNNNAALTIIDDVAVSGFAHGIIVNEHTRGDNLNLTCNKNALTFETANHSSYFGRVAAQRNQVNLNIRGRHSFDIAQLNLEHANDGGAEMNDGALNPGNNQTDAGNAWQVTQYDIKDTNFLGRGSVRWSTIIGNIIGQRSHFKETPNLLKTQEIRADFPCWAEYINSASVSIPNAQYYTLPFDTIRKGAAFLPTYLGSRIYAPSAGRFYLKFDGVFAQNSTGIRSFILSHVRAADELETEFAYATMPETAGQLPVFSVSGEYESLYNDWFIVKAYQNSGAALNLHRYEATFKLTIRKI